MRAGTMSSILIIADDLTGAVDTCAQFASRGIRASVAVEAEYGAAPRQAVHSMNAGTREISLAEARQKHFSIGRQIRPGTHGVIVKKTDMGFRGNHGGELEGLLEGLGAEVCYLVNAIPDHYASVVNACQYVKGKPLPESMYAQDPSRKPTTAFIPDILRKQTSLQIGTIQLEDVRGPNLKGRITALKDAHCRILVFDAVTAQDCLTIVKAACSLPYTSCFAGTLGIMNALSQYFFPDCLVQNPCTADPPPRCLGFTTSNYDTVQQQLQYAKERGLAQVMLRMDDCLRNDESLEAELERVRGACRKLLREQSVIVTQRLLYPPEDPNLSGRILAAMANCTERLCADCGFSRLVMIGGETSHAILNAIGAQNLSITAMPETGVALGRINDGRLSGYSFAAKGGSVGTVQAVWRMLVTADSERAEHFPGSAGL